MALSLMMASCGPAAEEEEDGKCNCILQLRINLGYLVYCPLPSPYAFFSI